MKTIALACALAAALPAFAQAPAAPAPAAPAADLQALLAAHDAAYKQRDDAGKFAEAKARLEQAEKLAPNDYGVLWRLARMNFWVSDDPKLKDEEKSRIGKIAWDYGDKASAANPNGVEGFYFAAIGMGNYSLGIGILRALSQGIEGKYKARLGKAAQINDAYDEGGIENAWGRFYFKLPWPKYDAERSEEHLKKALQINPHDLRGMVYLADLYLKEDKPKEAKKLIDQVLAATPNAYDPPEEKRAQELARETLPAVEKALK